MMRRATKTILARVLWLARGTSMALGLAVMLAVVLGVGSAALAAVPGDPFKLGQVNETVTTTVLNGSVDGPLLEISNSHDGSNTERASSSDPVPSPGPMPVPGGGSRATALKIGVHAGQPPLTVSPGAAKAPNLDSDELDGKDSTAFASGTNGKANDADKLDGKDSTAFANGTGGVANNAANSDKLDGLDSQDLKESAKLRCPSGTYLFVGVCFEQNPRPIENFVNAVHECGKAQRRLPSSTELLAVRYRPEGTGFVAADFEWSGDLAGIDRDLSNARYMAPTVNTERRNPVGEYPYYESPYHYFGAVKAEMRFRCVTLPTNL